MLTEICSPENKGASESAWLRKRLTELLNLAGFFRRAEATIVAVDVTVTACAVRAVKLRLRGRWTKTHAFVGSS